MTPKNLLASPALETEAEKWLATVAAARAADVNPFSGSLTLMVEPRLSSATRWYVTAEPAEIDSLEYAYLSGNEGPQVESRSGWGHRRRGVPSHSGVRGRVRRSPRLAHESGRLMADLTQLTRDAML